MLRLYCVKRLVILLTVAICVPVCADEAIGKYEFPQTRELVKFVRSAAALIAQKGAACFPEFKREGGKWFSGDRYVFVTSFDGMTLVNPPFPEALGKTLLDAKDPWGKPIVKLNASSLASAVDGTKEGWVHYQWPRPGSVKPEWKTTYVIQVDGPKGEKYIVGSGLYDMKIEKSFIEDVVNDAVDLIGKQGKEAFCTLNDKSSKYQFRDIYVFVMTDRGLELCNPGTPQIVGKNVWGYKSIDGKNVVQEMVKLVKNQGGGWISYIWTKPGDSNYYHKRTFVKGVEVDGQLLLVASGYYKQD